MLIINEFGGKRAETNFTFIAFIFLVFVFSRTVSVTLTTNIFYVFVTNCRKWVSSLNFAINKQYYLGQLNNCVCLDSPQFSLTRMRGSGPPHVAAVC